MEGDGSVDGLGDGDVSGVGQGDFGDWVVLSRVGSRVVGEDVVD